MWAYGKPSRSPSCEPHPRESQLGASVLPGPVLPTEFEMQVKRLRLTVETHVSSAELRSWCQQNRNRLYIPEWLLKEWKITVDPYISDAA